MKTLPYTVAALRSSLSCLQIAGELPGEQGRAAYECASRIDELLSSGLKLCPEEDVLAIDPWEVVINELSFMFGTPVAVARLRTADRMRVRGLITDPEYKRMLGEGASDRGLCAQHSGIVSPTIAAQLNGFYEAHASGREEVPLGILCSWDDETKSSMSEAASAYERAVAELGKMLQADKTRRYSALDIRNPSLLSTVAVAAVALYWGKDPGRRFLGTVELYLQEHTPADIKPVSVELVAATGLLVSCSLSSLGREDVERVPEPVTVPACDIPSYSEYRNDLEAFISFGLDASRQQLAQGDSGSSLPGVFDDLFRQTLRSLNRSCIGADQAHVAFVVPTTHDTGGRMGRYYFPKSFVAEVCEDPDAPNILRALAARRGEREGIPLDLGLLGYCRDARALAYTKNLAEDARVQSYDAAQKEMELKLFGKPKQVLEFPLLFFKDKKGHILPSSMLVFISSEEMHPKPRDLHALYRLVLDARYMLSKAFKAEVLREWQVDRVKTVIHDLQRMLRSFSSALPEQLSTKQEPQPSGSLPQQMEMVASSLRFDLYVAGRLDEQVKNPDPASKIGPILETMLDAFCGAFGGIEWPDCGWDVPETRWDTNAYDDCEPEVELYRGALFNVLWNLTHNAARFYGQALRETDGQTRLKARMRGQHPSVSCYVGPRDLESDTGLLATATFAISFPGINFGGIEACTLLDMSVVCVECSQRDTCGPKQHADRYANREEPSQGLWSCEMIIDKWWEFMKAPRGEMQRGVMPVQRAGLPVRFEFCVPVKFPENRET